MMSSFARILLFSAAAAILFLGERVSAYTYPIGVQIYTGCLPYEDFMGDYYDCKRFYRCSNGWKSSLYCPDGTVYDQSIRTCVNSPTGSCIKFANSPYGVNYNDYISYNGFTNYNNNNYKPNHYNVKSSLSSSPFSSLSSASSSSSSSQNQNVNNNNNNNNNANLETCPYSLSTLEKLVFCSLASFRQINAKCCL